MLTQNTNLYISNTDFKEYLNNVQTPTLWKTNERSTFKNACRNCAFECCFNGIKKKKEMKKKGQRQGKGPNGCSCGTSKQSVCSQADKESIKFDGLLL